MADWTISGLRTFRGEFEPPGDKSISHRAVILGALAEGTTRITNFLAADDCLRTLGAFRQLGTEASQLSDSEIVLHGGPLREPDTPLDMGNSGTGIRLLAGVLAAQPFLSILTGDASVRRRPMRRICDPLRKMGAMILSRSGDLAPLAIRGGGLRGIEYHTPVASAQIKSCILLAGMFAEGPTVVEEPEISRDHTERMLKAFGAKIMRETRVTSIEPGNTLKGRDVNVPGDLSSAAFFIVGALITPESELTISNVGLNPTRTGLLDALQQMGADLTVEEEGETAGEPVGKIVARSSSLKGAVLGGEMIPRMIDEIPVLALAASAAEGQTVISDAQELKVKESDRLESIASALNAIGAHVQPTEDGLAIQGGAKFRSGCVNSSGDHRIAMMGAIAAAASDGESVIEDVDCVDTSFPSFYNLLLDLTVDRVNRP